MVGRRLLREEKCWEKAAMVGDGERAGTVGADFAREREWLEGDRWWDRD